MDEEDEQEDQDQEEVEAEQQPTSPSDLGGVPWKEAVELHAKLRGNNGEEEEGEALTDAVSRDGEMDEEDEEDEEEEEDEDEEDSSDGTFFSHSWCDYNTLHVKTLNVCFLWCVLSLLHKAPLPFYRSLFHMECLCVKYCPHHPLLLSALFFPSSLLFHMSNVFVCECVCVCICVHVLGIFLPLLAEGDYCPWDKELQSGLWLEKYLTDEEDIGTFKGSSRSACGCVCINSECDVQSWITRICTIKLFFCCLCSLDCWFLFMVFLFYYNLLFNTSMSFMASIH